MDSKDSGAQNPYRALLFKLTGVGIQRPRLKSAVNTWRKTQRDEIEREVRRVVIRDGTPHSQLAKTRDTIARKLFEAIPAEEKKNWSELAKEEHEAALERWKRDTSGAPSKDPADRQQCIQSIVRFAQPILDLLNEATGWPVTLITGGPEPAHGGRLNIISLHAGTTSGDIKMNFGTAERACYKKFIVPTYGAFLQKCFSPEECREWALPDEGGFHTLESLDLNSAGGNFDTYSVGGADSSATLAHPPPAGTSTSDLHPSPPPHNMPSFMDPNPTASPPDPASPPGSRPASRGPTPAPTPSHSPHRVMSSLPGFFSSMDSTHLPPPPAPTPAQPAPRHVVPSPPRFSILSPDSIQFMRSQLTPTAAAPQSSPQLPSVSTHLSPTEPSASAAVESTSTAAVKRKHTNSDGGSPQASKRTRSARFATEGTMEESSSMEYDQLGSSPALPVSSKSLTRGVRHSSGLTRQSPGKKGRTSQAADVGDKSSSSSAKTEKVPAWFTNVLGMLESLDGGSNWTRLLEVWTAFERQEKYFEAKRLSGEGRPWAISEWMKRRRSQTWRPPTSKELGGTFMPWWISLQPKWRVVDGKVVSGQVGDLSVLKRSGIYGFVNVLVGLFFWHLDFGSKEEKEWLKIVEDCVTIFESFLSE